MRAKPRLDTGQPFRLVRMRLRDRQGYFDLSAPSVSQTLFPSSAHK